MLYLGMSCLHVWCLVLYPELPNEVEVSCAVCDVSIETVWDGVIPYIHMEMGDFTVDGGRHTATRFVELPLDIFIRESFVYSLQEHDFVKEMEVQITPRLPELSATAEEVSTKELEGGTGWCAPSP